jgi:hypothetical protein
MLLGGVAVAWRQALRHLGKQLFGKYLTSTTLPLIVPPFVAQRERWVRILVLIAVVVALAFLGWKAAVATLLGTYVLMEVSRFAYPRPTHPYYLGQLIDDLRSRLRIADHFGDAKAAAQLTSRLEVLEGQLPERQAQQAEEVRFWRRRCAQPPTESFAAICKRLPESERKEIDAKASQLAGICQGVITQSSPARAECERRRTAALLQAHYRKELGGDFSASTPKDRDTVVTLLATGFTYENLLSSSAPAVLSEVFPDDHRSPLGM